MYNEISIRDNKRYESIKTCILTFQHPWYSVSDCIWMYLCDICSYTSILQVKDGIIGIMQYSPHGVLECSLVFYWPDKLDAPQAIYNQYWNSVYITLLHF